MLNARMLNRQRSYTSQKKLFFVTLHNTIILLEMIFIYFNKIALINMCLKTEIELTILPQWTILLKGKLNIFLNYLL